MTESSKDVRYFWAQFLSFNKIMLVGFAYQRQHYLNTKLCLLIEIPLKFESKIDNVLFFLKKVFAEQKIHI